MSPRAMNLPEKIVALHQALAEADLPHAFGGALALAWCTQRARGTVDIDINIFVDSAHCESVFRALPEGVKTPKKQREELLREGQVRFWWDTTPLDIFLNTTEFHQQAAQRVRWETFMERPIPFLACSDLAVLKAFFNRTRDWADLEAMRDAGTLDIDKVCAVLIHYLGADDERIGKLEGLR